ncbi:hypothetical protein AB0F81_51280, partial [Actinoplanes sp. NPDC024001]|uniref:hypothetical protein n=1 Tax=Actinoplanes sp. NPDC024001 TaxID=3154598 RepID=UPI0033C3E8A2
MPGSADGSPELGDGDGEALPDGVTGAAVGVGTGGVRQSHSVGPAGRPGERGAERPGWAVPVGGAVVTRVPSAAVAGGAARPAAPGTGGTVVVV